ncbi:MAG: response regulator [Alphaproteobacteria bacterium]|nr:MAG: response regulator [Alphaproteobacteria bacterium]
MKVVIVEEEPELARLWAAHLQRLGAEVVPCTDAVAARAAIAAEVPDVLVLDVDMGAGAALLLADAAERARPGVRVIAVTRSRFFSDGSIFELLPGACTCLPAGVDPGDLGAVVTHYGAPRPAS